MITVLKLFYLKRIGIFFLSFTTSVDNFAGARCRPYQLDVLTTRASLPGTLMRSAITEESLIIHWPFYANRILLANLKFCLTFFFP